MGTAMDVEIDPSSLEEARVVVRELRERHRSQAHQILSWRRRAKAQEELLARLAMDHAEQLRGLSSQLLLFEARLCRKQKDIRTLLVARETCISRQARTIRALQARLSDAGLDSSLPDPDDLEPGTPLGITGGGDNDSDSAVILEDGSAMDLQLVLPLSSVLRYNSATAAVQRSISDATKFSSSGAGGKRGSNSFLRRPEVLETVYSVEEDQDGDAAPSQNDTHVSPEKRRNCHSDSDDIVQAVDSAAESESDEDTSNATQQSEESRRGSYESQRSYDSVRSYDRATGRAIRRHPPLRSRRAVDEDEPPAWSSAVPPQQVTYNRVMSNNHRSVTKPRDVKYKRINKAKSKSLEELRGRLKTWVEPQKQLTLDQSTA